LEVLAPDLYGNGVVSAAAQVFSVSAKTKEKKRRNEDISV